MPLGARGIEVEEAVGGLPRPPETDYQCAPIARTGDSVLSVDAHFPFQGSDKLALGGLGVQNGFGAVGGVP